MKATQWLGLVAVAAIFALMIGCGGGGGGGGTSTGTTGGPVHAQQISGYEGSSSGTMIDLRTLVPGDQIQLKITARDANNNLVVLSASGWTTNAPSSVAVVTSGGLLSAFSPSATSYQVRVSSGGLVYTANLNIIAAKAFVTGRVTDGSIAIQNAIIDFYDATGKTVGSTYTTRAGTFRASVPTTATKFMLDMSVPDPGFVFYYDEFVYDSDTYIEATNCLVKLPGTPSTSAPMSLKTAIVPFLRSLGPPPPPTGCIGP
jgi:hypothetical protein